MDEELQGEILSRIDALAEKMGTTAEHLWTALVGDAIREGVVGAIAGLIVALVFAGLAVFAFRMRGSFPPKMRKSYYGGESDANSESRVACIAAACILSACSLIAFSVGTGYAMDAAAPHTQAWRVLTGGK